MVQPDVAVFFKHHDFFNESIRRVARETGVVFVDNQKELAGKREYFADGVHYTLAGVERVARNYMEAIVAAALIDPGSPAEALARSEQVSDGAAAASASASSTGPEASGVGRPPAERCCWSD